MTTAEGCIEHITLLKQKMHQFPRCPDRTYRGGVKPITSPVCIAALQVQIGTWGIANFGDTRNIDAQNGQTYQVYTMTKDGFMLLVMRLQQAAKWRATRRVAKRAPVPWQQ
jgi:hypothetical protein